MVLASVFSTFGDALSFIVAEQDSRGGPGLKVGGPGELGDLAGNHFLISAVALMLAIALAMPLALWLGHLGRAEFLAVSTANVGRAVPALAIIAFCVAFLGTGFTNVCFALTLLAIPPILTNTYVGIRQVDRDLVDAARGQGLSELEIVRRIELPLALSTIFGGIRLSSVNVLATAIVAPEAGYDTLGTPIIAFNVYGTSGQIGAAIVIAILVLAADAGFAAVQRLVTPKGLKLAAGGRSRRRPLSIPRRRVQTS